VATNYAAGMSQTELTIIKSGIALLVSALTPYRDHPVISRKLFGIITLSFTIGDMLDFLVNNFGASASKASP
jgi:hypothetical protein